MENNNNCIKLITCYNNIKNTPEFEKIKSTLLEIEMNLDFIGTDDEILQKITDNKEIYKMLINCYNGNTIDDAQKILDAIIAMFRDSSTSIKLCLYADTQKQLINSKKIIEFMNHFNNMIVPDGLNLIIFTIGAGSEIGHVFIADENLYETYKIFDTVTIINFGDIEDNEGFGSLRDVFICSDSIECVENLNSRAMYTNSNISFNSYEFDTSLMDNDIHIYKLVYTYSDIQRTVNIVDTGIDYTEDIIIEIKNHNNYKYMNKKILVCSINGMECIEIMKKPSTFLEIDLFVYIHGTPSADGKNLISKNIINVHKFRKILLEQLLKYMNENNKMHEFMDNSNNIISPSQFNLSKDYIDEGVDSGRGYSINMTNLFKNNNDVYMRPEGKIKTLIGGNNRRKMYKYMLKNLKITSV